MRAGALIAIAVAACSSVAHAQADVYSPAELIALSSRLADQLQMPFDRRVAAVEKLSAIANSGRFSAATGMPMRGLFAYRAEESGLVFKTTHGYGVMLSRAGRWSAIDLSGKSFGAQAGGSTEWGFGLIVGPGDLTRLGGDYSGAELSATFGVANTRGVHELARQNVYQAVDYLKVLLVGSASGASANAGTATVTIRETQLVNPGPRRWRRRSIPTTPRRRSSRCTRRPHRRPGRR